MPNIKVGIIHWSNMTSSKPDNPVWTYIFLTRTNAVRNKAYKALRQERSRMPEGVERQVDLWN